MSSHFKRLASGRPGIILAMIVVVLVAVYLRPGEARNPSKFSKVANDFILIEAEHLVGGFSLLADLEVAEDGRMFAAQTSGEILIIESDGTILPKPFLDLSGLVDPVAELGLSSIALHPGFKNNGLFFVSYDTLDLKTYIVRYDVSQDDPNLADANSAQVILSVDQPSAVHNGAGLIFGPDEYLYIGLGDGGPRDDPQNNAQNGQTLSGSILRLDVDGTVPYEIPSSNPFVGDSSIRDEIWAMGLRNPWRFSFDRINGDLYIGDVGQDRWEEINYEPAGGGGGMNYGWRCYEGLEAYITANCGESASYDFPIYTLFNGKASTAIIGGYVYQGDVPLPIDGHYLFAEYRSGTIWSLAKNGDKWEITGAGKTGLGYLTTFDEGPSGELYVTDFSNIYKIDARSVTFSQVVFLPMVGKS